MSFEALTAILFGANENEKKNKKRHPCYMEYTELEKYRAWAVSHLFSECFFVQMGFKISLENFQRLFGISQLCW